MTDVRRAAEPSRAAALARLTLAGTIALVLVALLWETVLAPLRPGGSWLALKALPLAVLVPGLLRRVPRTVQWLALLLPFYLAEAIARGFTEPGRHALVAWVAAALAVATFVSALAWVRAVRAGSAASPR